MTWLDGMPVTEQPFDYSVPVARLRRDVIRVKNLLHEGDRRRSGTADRHSSGTIRYWVAHGLEATAQRAPVPCDPCARTIVAPPDRYAYLLGLYLGDGCLSASARNVYKLRIVLDVSYPGIIAECRTAMEAVCPNRVGQTRRSGCVEVSSYSKHWLCFFPQHGPGPKHCRPIALQEWQRRIAIDA